MYVACYKSQYGIRKPSACPLIYQPSHHITKVALPSHTMLYVLRPQSPSTVSYSHPLYLELDPEDAYVERKRREYLAALQQQQE